MSADPAAFRFVSTNRRVREDRRFVAGHGHFVADVALEGMLHVAILPSQHPAARIVSIDASAALAMAGVHYVLSGDELAAATDPLMNGLDTPKVRRYPLAVGQTRYAGEWVVAVVADTRALAEDATEKVRIVFEPLPFLTNAEDASKPDSPPVHPAHGSNVLLDRTFVWGEVEKHFAESPRHLSFRVTWGRNSTVPIETFGIAASWDPWREMLDVWASIQMPKYPDQIARALRIPANGVRVHQDVDVGGSYGVKRGIKQTVLVAHLARRLGRPVRLIEDRLENMRGGDAHGPERIFDIDVEDAFGAVGVAAAHVLQPVFDQTHGPAEPPRQMRHQHGLLDTALDAVAAADVDVLVHANAIGGNPQGARDLIGIFRHLDRRPHVQNIAPRVPGCGHAKRLDRNGRVASPGHTKRQMARTLGEMLVDLAPDEGPVQQHVRPVCRMDRWAVRLQ